MPRATRGAFVGRVQSVVEGVLRRELGAGDPELDDLTQSALERVLTTIEEGKFREDCPLQVWAAIIARRVAIDAIRGRTRDRLVFDRSETEDSLNRIPAMEGGPEHLAEMHGYLQRIESALGQLPPAKAQVVYLHDVLGYDLEEVARTMGTSAAAAQSRLVRGRHEIFESMRRSRPRTSPFTDENEKQFHGRMGQWRFITGYDSHESSACKPGSRAANKQEGSKSLRKGPGP